MEDLEPINEPSIGPRTFQIIPKEFKIVQNGVKNTHKAVIRVMSKEMTREAMKRKIGGSDYASPTQNCLRKMLEPADSLYLAPFSHNPLCPDQY